ncbi:hypothetical protein M0R45_005176 [Rubus argutus]|uniref:Uncharacterized protein n=1 Tax=Rubus argutus TaxID=59490 RepID=A0AAW1YM58_RUBAR
MASTLSPAMEAFPPAIHSQHIKSQFSLFPSQTTTTQFSHIPNSNQRSSPSTSIHRRCLWAPSNSSLPLYPEPRLCPAITAVSSDRAIISLRCCSFTVGNNARTSINCSCRRPSNPVQPCPIHLGIPPHHHHTKAAAALSAPPKAIHCNPSSHNSRVSLS